MTYALPSGVVNTDSLYLYAATPAGTLGPYVKQLSDQTLVIIDYTLVTPALILDSYTFSMDVSSNPQLVVSYPVIDSTGKLLSFLLSGGIVGQQYHITININADVRVDHFTVNIPSSSGNCDTVVPVPALYNQIPLWGGGYVNTAVRYFWGAAPPSNPNVLDQWFDTVGNALYEWVTDGTIYEWVLIYTSAYVTDAPNDGVLYGRLDNLWKPVPISEILFDAPGDGQYYARQNYQWSAVPRIPQPSDLPPLMDAATPVPGVSVDFARIDHVHPTDASLYPNTNPADYQTADDVDATLADYMPLTGGTFSGSVGFNASALFSTPSHLQVGGGNAGYVLSTNGASGLSWVPPTVGISDSPVNAQTYARSGGAWVNITTATGIPEAPNDGQLWGRESLTWVQIPIGGGAGISDAPNDATKYARQNNSWQHITHTDITDWATTLSPYALSSNIPAGSVATPLMNGASSPGSSLAWARGDHVHPVDTSRYSVSNPANYIPEAPNNGGGYVRRNLSWSFITHNDISDWAISTVPVTVAATAPGPGTTGPSPTLTGTLWWNTTNQQLYIWSGTDWVLTITPYIIPESPNDGTLYARRSTGGTSTWSHITHNDITDWAATLGSYLPLSGGTLTGALTVPSLVSNGTVSTGPVVSVIGAGGGAGAYVGYWDGTTRKGYMGQFGANGMLWVNDAAQTNIQLHPNGNIYLNAPVATNGTLTANGVIHSNSDITAAGNMSCGTMYSQISTGGTVAAGYLHSTGSSQIDGNEQVNGNFNCTNTVSGYTGNFSYSTIYGNLQVNGLITSSNIIRSTYGHIVAQGNSNPGLCAYHTAGYATTFFCDANGLTVIGDADGNGIAQNYRFTIDRSSNATINGQCNVGGAAVAGGPIIGHAAIYVDNTNGAFYHRDSSGNVRMSLYCDGGRTLHLTNNTTGSDCYLDANPFFVVSGIAQAFKPGGGSWQAISDRRIKDVIGSYKAGLKEILSLEPIEFTYKDNHRLGTAETSMHSHQTKERAKMVGYVADDIMKVLPETVTLQKGFIDEKEVDDLKTLDMTNITHALVNAVKELHAEVQSLRAELRTLRPA